jgi:hypothetical protein
MSKRATQRVDDCATQSEPPNSLPTRSSSAPASPTPKRASTLAAAHHDALLDACWAASGTHAATTVAALLTYIVDHVRQHPDFGALGLERLVDWLVGLRARQPDGATLFVGRGAVNRVIDAVVDAVDASDLEAQLKSAGATTTKVAVTTTEIVPAGVALDPLPRVAAEVEAGCETSGNELGAGNEVAR